MDRDEQIRRWNEAKGEGGAKQVQFGEELRKVACGALWNLYGHASHAGDVRTMIDDSVSEALTEFWGRYDPNRSVSQSPITFVIGRAMLRLRTKWKQEGKRQKNHVVLHDIDHDSSSSMENPADAAIKAEREAKLAECMKKLPSELWRVLQEIHFFEMISKSECARRHGHSVKWVSARVEESYEWLRRCIESKSHPELGGGA